MDERYDDAGGREPGGIVGRDEITAAALAALAGIDPMWLLRSDDALEVRVAQAVAQKHLEIRQQLAESDAVMIAIQVGKLFGG